MPQTGQCAAYRPERLCAEGRLDACLAAGRNLERRGEPYAGYAADLYRFACEKGAAGGCAGLARQYESGVGIERDLTRAAAMFELACTYGDANACLVRAERLRRTGDERATELFAQACHRGNAIACARYADCLSGAGAVPGLAQRYYAGACLQGVGHACLALLQAEGQHEAVSSDRARLLLELSCEGRDAEGCKQLGDAYLDGLIVPQSSARAAESFRLACEGGHLLACGQLGTLVEQGDGVRRDLGRARELYRRACEAGVAAACERATGIAMHARE